MIAEYSTLISVSQLTDMIKHPHLRTFDCRFNLMDEKKGLEDYKLGHIENSQYADLNQQLAGPVLNNSGRHPLPDKSEFEQQLRHWGIDESSQVVVYDDVSGSIAARLWWLCKWAGIKRVAVLDGGLTDWLKQHKQLTREIVRFDKTIFNANYNDNLWVSTENLVNQITSAQVLLTDARAVKRFRGETEPIDSRAGHVPGAVNFPFENNLDSEGRFLSIHELLEIHQQATDKPEVISMCGSGVTACHNILARAHAGLGMGQLYVGSWSEWITNPVRQIESIST